MAGSGGGLEWSGLGTDKLLYFVTRLLVLDELGACLFKHVQ